MITMSSLLSLLLGIAVVGLVFWLLWWLIGYMGLPEPFNKICMVVLAIAAVVVLISFLFQVFGYPPIVSWK